MEAKKFTVSVSSAKSFSDCNMQWFIGSVLGIRKPDTPATKIGTVFAELCEAYTIRDTKKIDEIILNSQNDTVRMLYEKNHTFFLELHNKVKSAEFELAFGLNLYISYSGWIDAILEDENSITVRDYKTANSWAYTLTEKTMGADEQLNIYGYFINKFYNPKNKPIWLEHQQFHKGTGMRKEVRVPYNHEEGKAIYDWLVEQAEQMLKVKFLPVAQVNKNFDSCKAFGGCPYINYCKGQINLEELKNVLNPNIVERTRDQLIEMKPEERLEEVKKEKAFNEKGKEVLTKINKGADMGLSIKEKLLALKAKQDEARKQNEFPDIPKTEDVVEDKEIAVKNVGIVEPVKDKLSLNVAVVKEVVAPEPRPETENPLKRKRRTKAEMEVEASVKISNDSVIKDGKIIEVVKQDPTLSAVYNNMTQDLKDNLTKPLPLQLPGTKQVLVLVGCAFLEETKNNPSDFLHEKYIEPILKQERIPHISCSEFSKANKSVMLFAQSILKEIYENYESINIDIRRPVDALVYTMILDLDARKDDQKRFKLIRSTF